MRRDGWMTHTYARDDAAQQVCSEEAEGGETGDVGSPGYIYTAVAGRKKKKADWIGEGRERGVSGLWRRRRCHFGRWGVCAPRVADADVEDSIWTLRDRTVSAVSASDCAGPCVLASDLHALALTSSLKTTSSSLFLLLLKFDEACLTFISSSTSRIFLFDSSVHK
jgi:hypothetical protein